MLKCAACGQHISRIDASIGIRMADGEDDGKVICPTCVVTLGLIAPKENTPAVPNGVNPSVSDSPTLPPRS